MFTQLLSLFTAVQMLLTGLFTPQGQLEFMFRTGMMLRLHVVAQDDTPEMQRIKLCVRDAVQSAYAANHPDENATMLQNTRALLPLLAQAAEEAALAEGFTGPVRVELTTRYFDALPLSQNTVPAGEYPALMVYLGDAQGHNWWGLIDPETATAFAQVPASVEAADAPLTWDWSWQGFLAALLSPFHCAKEATSDAAHP